MTNGIFTVIVFLNRPKVSSRKTSKKKVQNMKETLENTAFRGNPIDGWINRLPNLQKWLDRNEHSVVLAFYNTGTELFIEPSREPSNSFYSKNWLLVEKEAFKRMGRIMFYGPKAVGKQRKKKSQNTIRFCHSGYTQDGRALINFNHGIKLKRFEKKDLIFKFTKVRFFSLPFLKEEFNLTMCSGNFCP